MSDPTFDLASSSESVTELVTILTALSDLSSLTHLSPSLKNKVFDSLSQKYKSPSPLIAYWGQPLIKVDFEEQGE